MSRKYQIAATIFLGVLLWILLGIESSPSTIQICEEYPPYSGHEKCTPYNIFYVPIVWTKDGLNNESGVITGIATALLAVITGFLVHIARLQNETTRAQMRANIFSTQLNWYWIADPAGGPYHFRVGPVWSNTGETQTKRLRIHSLCHISATPLPPGFNFEYPTPNFGTGLIAPRSSNTGGEYPGFPHAPISPQEIFDAQNNIKFIYLYGWARYYDIFPKTVEHITRYCWIIRIIGDPFTFVPNDPQHELRFSFVMHTEGNSADEESG